MPRSIAIVEDEAAIRLNYMDALRRQNYQVSGFSERDSACLLYTSDAADEVVPV